MDLTILATLITAIGGAAAGLGGLRVALLNRRDSRKVAEDTHELAERSLTREELTTIIAQQRGWNDRLAEENGALRERVALLEADNASLRADLAAARAEAATAKAEAVQAHAAADECHAEVAELRARIHGGP